MNGSPYFLHSEFAKAYSDEITGKKVYLAVNFHNFSSLYQNRLLNDSLLPGWRTSIFKQMDEYYMFNQFYSTLVQKDMHYNPIDLKKIPKLLKGIFWTKNERNSSLSVEMDTLAIQKAIRRHWKNEDYILKDSIQESHLYKLITRLKSYRCEVILLKMPVTNYYYDNVPYKIRNKLNQVSDSLSVRMLDLHKELSLSKNYSYFKDYGHLNSSGDAIISGYLKKHEDF